MSTPEETFLDLRIRGYNKINYLRHIDNLQMQMQVDDMKVDPEDARLVLNLYDSLTPAAQRRMERMVGVDIIVGLILCDDLSIAPFIQPQEAPV